MSKVYEWKETDGGWDALDASLGVPTAGMAVAHVYTSQSKDLGLIYIAYAYSNPDDKVGSMTLEQAKIAAINLHEYPADVEVEDPKTPPAINRQDPAWAMFAAAYLPMRISSLGNEWVEKTTVFDLASDCAVYADAMIRERDRRDREKRP